MQGSSQDSSSVVKRYAYDCLDKLNQLAGKHIKSTYIQKFWHWFATRHIKKIINESPDSELRGDLNEIYLILKPLFEKVSVADELKNSPTDEAIKKKVYSMPGMKEIADLL